MSSKKDRKKKTIDHLLFEKNEIFTFYEEFKREPISAEKEYIKVGDLLK